MTHDATTNILDHEYKKKELTIRKILLSKFLQAMREDLSEWITSLSFHVTVTSEDFLSSLENGIILCQQARLIQRYAEEYAVLNPDKKLKIPTKEVYYTEKGALPGSFIARDNVANFILWCKGLGIPDVCLFESEDLVLQKNEKSVILTLLDVARKAYTFGVQPPQIVRYEKEIDDEIEHDKEEEKKGRPPPKARDLEEDNNLDAMVRRIVNRCTCYDAFPIKKLAEGKYKLGKSDTLIFVRVMRKNVMVRVGGGWDTFEHYMTKHDPCRTKVAGNIEDNGKMISSPASNINITPQRKKSTSQRESIKSSDPFSTNSSDTWSMCSGSSDGSGSLETSRVDCHSDHQGRKPLQRKSSCMSTGSAATDDTPGNTDVAISFTKSIDEIDKKLKLLDSNKPLLDLTMKDPSVYDNKGDRWLRSHMNTIKQRRLTVGHVDTSSNPSDEFVMKRGYTAGVIERKQKINPLSSRTDRKSNHLSEPRSDQRTRSKTAPKNLSNSLDQGLNTNQGYNSLPRLRRRTSKGDLPIRRRGQSPSYDQLSSSDQSLNSLASEPTQRSCCNMSTQTEMESENQSRMLGLPRALKNRIPDSIGSPSKIPRPRLQRSNTLDGTSRLRKRNLNYDDPLKVPTDKTNLYKKMGLRREKSDISGKMVYRREKSDMTGRQTKSKENMKHTTPRKIDIKKNEKAVRIRNGAVLDVK